MMNRKWNGTTKQTLEKHIDCHWSAFVCLSEATDCVSHQITNERIRVVYLIGSIYSKDSEIISALAEICQEDTGMRENFDLADIFLNPTCMVAKKQGNKKVAFNTAISATNGKQYGRVKMGMELWYHNKHEFLALSQDQKDEMVAYNATKDGGKFKGDSGELGLAGGKRNGEGGVSSSNKKLKLTISSMIADATNKK